MVSKLMLIKGAFILAAFRKGPMAELSKGNVGKGEGSDGIV
jgi:hypothetical protein